MLTSDVKIGVCRIKRRDNLDLWLFLAVWKMIPLLNLEYLAGVINNLRNDLWERFRQLFILHHTIPPLHITTNTLHVYRDSLHADAKLPIIVWIWYKFVGVTSLFGSVWFLGIDEVNVDVHNVQQVGGHETNGLATIGATLSVADDKLLRFSSESLMAVYLNHLI